MLVIFVKGGLVQDVLMSEGAPEPVVICDGDTDGSDNLAETPWGECDVREFRSGCGPLSDSEEAQIIEALEVCGA